MDTEVTLESIYAPSEDVVVRLIEGELIIVPLVSGIGDLEDELFTLNETGKAIWDQLDGEKPLQEVVKILSAEYVDPAGEIETDVIGLVEELLRRGIIAKGSQE